VARYSKKEAGHNFCDIILPYHNYEQTKIVARYHLLQPKKLRFLISGSFQKVIKKFKDKYTLNFFQK